MSQKDYERSEILLRDAERQSPGRSLDYVDKILGNIDINLARHTRSQKEFERLLSAYEKRHEGTTPDLKRYQRFFDERKFNQEYPLEISNSSPNSRISLSVEETERVPRIYVPVQMGSRNINFLLDSGATISTLFNPELENIDLIDSGINIKMYMQGFKLVETKLSNLIHVKIGQTEIKNLQVLNVTDGPFDDELRKKEISGLLGSDIIEKFGGVQLSTKNYRITKAEFYTPKDKNIDPLNGNFLRHYRDPHVKVSIGDKVYTCVFDTGATKSHITLPIYKEHKKALGLKRISGKKLDRREYSRNYLSRPFKDRNYVIELPVKAGGVDFILQRVVVNEVDRFNGDCLIGLDAVLETGGAKLDFVNYKFELGPQKQPIQ